MSSSGTAAPTAGLGNSGHESGEREDLFDPLRWGQRSKLPLEGSALQSVVGAPIAGSCSSFHRAHGTGSVMITCYGCSNVCWYCVGGPLP
jgi:hypothetical protein